MSQTQTIQHANMLISLPYPFLSQPPKNKQRRRAAPAPEAPLPSPPPPSPKSKISMWSQKVAPGPPAPRSPFNASPLAQAPTHTARTPSTAGSAPLHDHRVDLASVGYAAMFVSFAAGPHSARLAPPTPAPTPTPAPAAKAKALALAALRPRSKSTSHAKPAAARAKKHLPPPASTDAALMQLLDGGAAPLALRAPDELEALEYAPLLSAGPASSAASAWVRFSVQSIQSGQSGMGGPSDEKRESVDSDLRSAYRVLPRELDPAVPTSLPPALARNRTLLALPARGGRGGVARHLAKPLYLAEIELAFPKTPTSPSTPAPATPKSPRSIRGRARRTSARGRKGGRRPAPLNLAPLAPQSPRGEFLSDSFAPSPRRSPRPPPRGNSESSDATLCGSEGAGLVKAGGVWEREEARRGALKKKPSMALKGMRRMFGRA